MRMLPWAVLLVACTAPPVSPAPQVSPAPATSSPVATVSPSPPPRADVRIRRVPDRQWQKMLEAEVVRAGCPMGRADLRRVEVNFYTFDGGVKRGQLVVNRDVAKDVAAIFTDIFKARFPIRSMKPIEEFGGDDNASMAANNTSAYNCRNDAQANSNPYDSPHANGRAVDINPVQNPWLDPRCDCFMPTGRNAARTPGRGKILEGGAVWKAFTERGWIWQNIATPDYQHFDTGYPSRPR